MSGVSIELADDEGEQNLDALAEQFDRLKKSAGRRRMPRKGDTVASDSTADRKVEVRRLKDAPADFTFALSKRAAEADAPKGLQNRTAEELRDQPPVRDPNKAKPGGNGSGNAGPVRRSSRSRSRQS